MSGAHDTNPVYPDKQESITNFEDAYERYDKESVSTFR